MNKKKIILLIVIAVITVAIIVVANLNNGGELLGDVGLFIQDPSMIDDNSDDTGDNIRVRGGSDEMHSDASSSPELRINS